MLRRRVRSVVGIDPHEASVVEARAYGDDIEYQVGAVEDLNLPKKAFDVVSAVEMLHHVEHGDGLHRLSELVAPGGVLLIVGLARSRSLRDYTRDARDAVAIRRHTLTKSVWDTPAPKIWPPPLSYEQARAKSLEVLPDACFERVPYFRFGLTWVKKQF
jgi:ubiquinone/menaquinone biosynthesis C-methylase UbiE